MKEENKTKKKDDYLLPLSIVIAAVLISFSLIYNAGKNVKEKYNVQDPNTSDSQIGEVAVQNIVPVTKDDHIKGSINAPIKIVEYVDLECPFCKKYHFTLESVKSIYGDQVAVVFRHFPLVELHSKAPKEAQASECAAKLGGNDAFWKFVGKVFEITPSNDGLDLKELPNIADQIGLNKDEFQKCLDSDYGKDIVKNHYNDALNAGAQGTPYSIVINNADKKYVIGGAYPLSEVKKVIDRAIKEGK